MPKKRPGYQQLTFFMQEDEVAEIKKTAIDRRMPLGSLLEVYTREAWGMDMARQARDEAARRAREEERDRKVLESRPAGVRERRPRKEREQ